MRCPVRTAVVLLLVTSAAAAAPVPKSLKKKSDAELLEGRWVGVTLDGGQGPKADAMWWKVIQDGKMSSGNGTPERPPDTLFTLDESQSPKHMDVTWKTVKEPLPYIYKLEGDTLTVCHAQPGRPRPTEFKGGGPGGQYCLVFKRVKEESKDK